MLTIKRLLNFSQYNIIIFVVAFHYICNFFYSLKLGWDKIDVAVEEGAVLEACVPFEMEVFRVDAGLDISFNIFYVFVALSQFPYSMWNIKSQWNLSHVVWSFLSECMFEKGETCAGLSDNVTG